MGPAFYLLYGGVQIWWGHAVVGATLILAAVFLMVLYLRPPTVVDATGIRRPWRWRRRAIAWSDIDAILARPVGTEPFTAPRVTLAEGGRPVILDDIPADQADCVARIGDRPLRRVPVPGVPTSVSAPPREKVRSDTDVEADVARRAAALKKRWTDLEAENRHCPPARDRAVGTRSTPGE